MKWKGRRPALCGGRPQASEPRRRPSGIRSSGQRRGSPSGALVGRCSTESGRRLASRDAPRVALLHLHLQLARPPARVADAHPEVALLGRAGRHQGLGAVEIGVRDALDHSGREPIHHEALERVQAVDLELAHGGVGADEHPAVAHLAMPAPDAPAVDLERRGSIQDDALGEVLVVLEKQEHALVKELLPEREAVLLLRAAEQDRTLLDERGLVDEAGRRLLACGLSNELCSHLAPVHIFGHACRGAAACMQRSTHGGCGYEEALRPAPGEEGEHREGFGRVGAHCIF